MSWGRSEVWSRHHSMRDVLRSEPASKPGGWADLDLPFCGCRDLEADRTGRWVSTGG